MKTKLFVVITVVLSCLNNIYADGPGFYLRIISDEVAYDSINQKLKVRFFIHSTDTIDYDSIKLIAGYPKLPTSSGFSAENVMLSTGWSHIFYDLQMLPGDSLADSLEINYSNSRIPFYYQMLEMNCIMLSDSTKKQWLLNHIYLYFTPYGTINIWNIDDFEKLIRVWNFDDYQQINKRVLANQSDLPVTNLTLEEFINDSISKSYISHPALSYLVPIKKVIDTFDADEPLPGVPSMRADGCKHNHQRWTGVISGNLRALVEHDFEPDGVVINLRGISVEVWEKDQGTNVDDFLGFGQTDVNGNFSISVNTCQRYTGSPNWWANEGNNLEIYLKIRGTNGDGSISTVTKYLGTRVVTWRQSDPILWNYNGGNTSNLNVGQIWPSTTELQPQLIHWANLCREFVKSTNGISPEFDLGSSSRPLFIKYRPEAENGSFFIPKGVPTNLTKGSNYGDFDHDRIYIEHTARNDEDIIFHEFGHFFMYHAQNKSWIEHGRWGDHDVVFNAERPELAWTEGWADGFSQIIDVFYRNLDGEGGNNGRDNEFRVDVEERLRSVKRPGNNNVWQERTLTHGFVSEYNVACFLLDLYDGPGRTAFRRGTIVSDDGWVNVNFWGGGADNLQLSFANIAQPLFDHSGGGLNSTKVLKNIEEYVFALTEITDCNLKQRVLPCATLNRLHNLSLDPNLPTEWFGTDRVGRLQSYEYNKYTSAREGKDFDFKFKGVAGFQYQQDVPLLDGINNSFNLSVEKNVKFNGHLSDPLTVQNNATLGLNINQQHGFFNLGPSLFLAPPNPSLYSVCISNQVTRITEGGILEVGDANGTVTCEARVTNATRLIVGGGNNIARIIINNNSKLVIENGAILEVFPNYEIVLNGSNAVLEIKGELRLRAGVTFTVMPGNGGFGRIFWYRNVQDWNNPPSLQINGDPHCRFVLEGNGYSHNLLTVDGNDGIYGPASVLDEFIVRNCQILLGVGTKLNPEPAVANGYVEFKNVKIDPLYPGQKHSGIIFNGVKNLFESVMIDQANRGITVFNWGNKNRLNLQSFSITNCNKGVYCLNVAYNIQGGVINNSLEQAIYGNGIDADCHIHSLNAANLTNQGIVLEQFQHNNVTLKSIKSNYSKGKVGVYHFSGTLQPMCNEIMQNQFVGYSSYIWGKFVAPGAGYNYINNNPIGLHFEDMGTINIHQGKNAVQGSTVYMEGGLAWPQPNAIYPNGNTSPLNDITLLMQNNAIGSGTLLPNRLLSPPSSWHYSLNTAYPVSRQYANIDLNAYSLSNFNTDKDNQCSGLLPPPVGGIYLGRKPFWYVTNPLGLGQLLVIPCNWNEHVGSLGVVNIKDSIEKYYNDFYNDTADNYLYVVNGLKPYIANSYSNLQPCQKSLLFEGYRLFTSALHEAVYAGVLPVSKDPNTAINAQIQTSIDLIQAIVDGATTESSPWYEIRYNLQKDIAHLYTLAARPSMAIQQLQSMVSANNSELRANDLNYWICNNQTLSQLYTGARAALVLEQTGCDEPIVSNYFDNNESDNIIAFAGTSSLAVKQGSIRVYPNPGNGIFTIESDEQINEIVIYDGNYIVIIYNFHKISPLYPSIIFMS